MQEGYRATERCSRAQTAGKIGGDEANEKMAVTGEGLIPRRHRGKEDHTEWDQTHAEINDQHKDGQPRGEINGRGKVDSQVPSKHPQVINHSQLGVHLVLLLQLTIAIEFVYEWHGRRESQAQCYEQHSRLIIHPQLPTHYQCLLFLIITLIKQEVDGAREMTDICVVAMIRCVEEGTDSREVHTHTRGAHLPHYAETDNAWDIAWGRESPSTQNSILSFLVLHMFFFYILLLCWKCVHFVFYALFL